MDKTRISLFSLGSYLVIIGIGLLLAPHQTLKILPTGTTVTSSRAFREC